MFGILSVPKCHQVFGGSLHLKYLASTLNRSFIVIFVQQTHEIAVDMRRIWKSLKEAQEQGHLLNQRQKLFGLPVIPFEAITKLIKEFEPYKNLWITASGTPNPTAVSTFVTTCVS